MAVDYILLDGKIETLSFFSHKLADSLKMLGYTVYVYNMDSLSDLVKYIEPDHTILITFNCIGLSDEPEITLNNTHIWQQYHVKAINILVDHPMYYHEQLMNRCGYSNPDIFLNIICIDRYHLSYLNNYYSFIKNSSFMPLAGSSGSMPCEKTHKIIFTGNYTPASTFDKYIKRNGPEYEIFYRDIIDELLLDTNKTIEEVCIKHIKDNVCDASDADLSMLMSKMIFIDLYVRFYIREKVIRTIADSGLDIVLIGKGFEAIKCKKQTILHGTELLPTTFCLDETAKSLISVNIMPWFKDGSHDRILSSMLCNTLSFTDGSKWLSENFENKKDLVFYDNMNIDEIPYMLSDLLANPDILAEISENGHKKALEHHTWHSRAKEIEKIFN